LVSCHYPIEGGLLARRPGGEIDFAQTGDGPTVLRSAIRGFFPGPAARAGSPDWTGALYNRVQSRIHVVVSRRYFARLIGETRGGTSSSSAPRARWAGRCFPSWPVSTTS